MYRTIEVSIKCALAISVYLWLHNTNPEHAIALAVAILSA